MLSEMERSYESSYVEFVRAKSLAHRDTFAGRLLPAEVQERFSRLAEESLAQQRRIEAEDNMDFETYRQKYLALT
jgi:glutamate--cysteine ligase